MDLLSGFRVKVIIPVRIVFTCIYFSTERTCLHHDDIHFKIIHEYFFVCSEFTGRLREFLCKKITRFFIYRITGTVSFFDLLRRMIIGHEIVVEFAVTAIRKILYPFICVPFCKRRIRLEKRAFLKQFAAVTVLAQDQVSHHFTCHTIL